LLGISEFLLSNRNGKDFPNFV